MRRRYRVRKRRGSLQDYFIPEYSYLGFQWNYISFKKSFGASGLITHLADTREEAIEICKSDSIKRIKPEIDIYVYLGKL